MQCSQSWEWQSFSLSGLPVFSQSYPGLSFFTHTFWVILPIGGAWGRKVPYHYSCCVVLNTYELASAPLGPHQLILLQRQKQDLSEDRRWPESAGDVWISNVDRFLASPFLDLFSNLTPSTLAMCTSIMWIWGWFQVTQILTVTMELLGRTKLLFEIWRTMYHTGILPMPSHVPGSRKLG